jgi:hypothetical protein
MGEEFKDKVKVIEGMFSRVGFPVLLLVGLFYAIWRGAIAMEPKIDTLLETHTSFVKSVEATNKQLVEQYTHMNDQGDQTNALLLQIQRSLETGTR